MINYIYYIFVVLPIILMAISIYGISVGWADDHASKEWKDK